MGSDSLAENTPKFVCPSPKVWYFNEKRLHWVSVVCGLGFPIRFLAMQKIRDIRNSYQNELYIIYLCI